jgi:hypothetical protein
VRASLTMLAHEGAALEKAMLAGREERCVPTRIFTWPTTPVEGEARGWGEKPLCPTPGLHSLPSTPGEEEAGRRVEEVSAGKVDRPGYWGPSMLWLLPPPRS